LKRNNYHCKSGKDRKNMKVMNGRYGTWALVAGAAEGIGEGFCTMLATNGFNIILVDKNARAMHELAVKLEYEYHVKSSELHLDLAAPDAADLCMKAAISTDCRLMVYIAAYSRVCRFTELDRSGLDGFLSVNTQTLLYLVHGFSNRLLSEGKTGGIILLSSLAGLIGPQYVAAYAATKAFGIRLTEALHDELKENGIDITVCCAGTVSTPTYWKSRPSFEKMRPPIMQPEEVARYAISCLGIKTICIPGLLNRLQYFFLMNLIPRKVAYRIVNNAMKKMYGLF
jgi:short-subunit dehydrogenase